VLTKTKITFLSKRSFSQWNGGQTPGEKKLTGGRKSATGKRKRLEKDILTPKKETRRDPAKSEKEGNATRFAVPAWLGT